MNSKARIVIDLAFSSMGRPSLIMSYHNMNNNWHHNHVINNEATAVRQMSEWGMQGFQNSFPHLLPYCSIIVLPMQDRIKFDLSTCPTWIEM
jgi:hypothetical protein